MTGLIIAMESELNAILERMEDVKENTTAGVTFYEGTLAGKPITAALAGVGKVAAAMATTLMAQLYKPDILINIGVAGGLRPEQHVEDLVLSELVIQADFDTEALDGVAGLGKRFIPDADLLNKGLRIAKKLDIPHSTGVIATQDLFMSRPEDFARLMSRFPRSACSEMEGGAVAQVAASFGIPFLVIRTLSDVVHHEDNHMEFSQFAAKAAKRAADFMEAWCQEN